MTVVIAMNAKLWRRTRWGSSKLDNRHSRPPQAWRSKGGMGLKWEMRRMMVAIVLNAKLWRKMRWGSSKLDNHHSCPLKHSGVRVAQA